jgi:hypothetical protein
MGKNPVFSIISGVLDNTKGLVDNILDRASDVETKVREGVSDALRYDKPSAK